METITAKGASGTIYKYFAVPGVTTWLDVPANYLFASRGVAGWKVHYIGQCDSAMRRLPTHERWDEAVRKYGATEILTHQASQNEEVRKTEERDLILSHDPPMNIHHRPQNALRGLLG